MSTPKTIRFNREDLPVSGSYHIQGKQYWVVGKHSRPPRETLRVIQQIGKRRKEKVIHQLEDNPESWRLIERVESFDDTRMPFPKIVDATRRDGEILVVRNYVVGRSLRWHLRMKEEISVFQAIRLYQQLVGQICFLHRKTGIVHGDLAPENMIVSPSGTSVSLIDFGSSFPFAESANPKIGDGFREVYQPPEVLAGNSASRLSEQFSAASIFYEMLTRKTPFNVAAKRESNSRKTALVPASEITAAEKPIPKLLWQVIDRHLAIALSLDAGRRFQTLKEWQTSVDDLQIKSKHPELLELERRNQSLWKRFNSWFNR